MPLSKYQRLRIARNKAAAQRRKAKYARKRASYGPINYYKPYYDSAFQPGVKYTRQGRRYYTYRKY